MFIKYFGFAFVLALFVLNANVDPVLAVSDIIIQMQGKMLRNTCQSKFPQVSQAKADGIHNGIFPSDQDSKCYMNCIMEALQVMKDGRLELEKTLQNTKAYMPEKFADYANGLYQCKNVANGVTDKCDASYRMVACLYLTVKTLYIP